MEVQTLKTKEGVNCFHGSYEACYNYLKELAANMGRLPRFLLSSKAYIIEPSQIILKTKNTKPMRRLNVKKTNVLELSKKWGFMPLALLGQSSVYIRCNTEGVINWEKAPAYTAHELIERDNVKIIK